MATKEKPQLFVEQRQYREHGYDNTVITIRTGRATTLDSLIEGCIDNKVGYYDESKHGGPSGLETAAKMQRRYEWLKGQGYTAIHEKTITAPMPISSSNGNTGPVARVRAIARQAYGSLVLVMPRWLQRVCWASSHGVQRARSLCLKSHATRNTCSRY